MLQLRSGQQTERERVDVEADAQCTLALSAGEAHAEPVVASRGRQVGAHATRGEAVHGHGRRLGVALFLVAIERLGVKGGAARIAVNVRRRQALELLGDPGELARVHRLGDAIVVRKHMRPPKAIILFKVERQKALLFQHPHAVGRAETGAVSGQQVSAAKKKVRTCQRGPLRRTGPPARRRL